MYRQHRFTKHLLVLIITLLSITACASQSYSGKQTMQSVEVKLSGAESVPPVQSYANADATLVIDKKTGEISGHINFSGLDATKAHIHLGTKGNNGKVVVGLQRENDYQFVIPDFTTLDQQQLATLMDGGMYLQIHSQQYPKGELRGQIMP